MPIPLPLPWRCRYCGRCRRAAPFDHGGGLRRQQRAPGGRDRMEQLCELSLRERLRQERIHAGREATFAIARQRVRRQRDDRGPRHAAGAFFAPDFLSCRVAVHDGHLAVHQDHVEGIRTPEFDGRATVFGHDDIAAELLEHGACDRAVDQVVVGDQYVESEARQALAREFGGGLGRVGVRAVTCRAHRAQQETQLLLSHGLGNADVRPHRPVADLAWLEVERAQQCDIGVGYGGIQPDRAQQVFGRGVGQRVIEQHDVERRAQGVPRC